MGMATNKVIINLERCPICGDYLACSGDNICPRCSSRSRVRAFYALRDVLNCQWLANTPLPELPILAFSATSMERDALAWFDRPINYVSLYGEYGAECKTGWDIRNLESCDNSCFSAIYSCLVFDFVLEQEQAIFECSRVLASGGIFMTHIGNARLKAGALTSHLAPRIKCSFPSHPKPCLREPAKEQLNHISVGVNWFLDAMQQAGFATVLATVADPTGDSPKWLLGRKS